MHSKSPYRRCDEGFRSAGEDDICSENRGFCDLKKYYVYRYGCHIKDVKNKGAGMTSILFALLYCLLQGKYRLKINITPYGESSIIQLTEIKFKIWRVTFLRSF